MKVSLILDPKKVLVCVEKRETLHKIFAVFDAIIPASDTCLCERAVDEALVETVIDDRDETNAFERLVHLVRDGCARVGVRVSKRVSVGECG